MGRSGKMVLNGKKGGFSVLDEEIRSEKLEYGDDSLYRVETLLLRSI